MERETSQEVGRGLQFLSAVSTPRSAISAVAELLRALIASVVSGTSPNWVRVLQLK